MEEADLTKIDTVIRAWLEQVVIGLNLCPFARPVVNDDRLRISISQAATEEAALIDLQQELILLADSEPTELETTLLALPAVLKDFQEFNQFLDLADLLLEQFDWSEEFQIASFHPAYQFAGTEPDAPGNLTNRAPVALLHILRQRSVAAAVDAIGDPADIPVRNIAMMESLAESRRRQLFPWLYPQQPRT